MPASTASKGISATTVAAAAKESSNPGPENGAVPRCIAGERPADTIPSGATTGERLNQHQPECRVKKSVRVGMPAARPRSTEKLPLGALFGKSLEALAQLSKAPYLREEF